MLPDGAARPGLTHEPRAAHGPGVAGPGIDLCLPAASPSEPHGDGLERGQEYLIEARLFALAQEEGFGSVNGLLEGLQTEPEIGSLHRRVIEAMLNGETSFFRDFYPFEELRLRLIPDLLAKRSGSRTLQIWSAAVASGQEAYSVAMLLREHFPRSGRLEGPVLATDVSESMLGRRARGAFARSR